MNLNHGITFNGKHSYTDFGLVFADKTIGIPSPNTIFKTVPYMNGQHDFSKLNGEITYGPRSLDYQFDIVGNDPNTMNSLKNSVLAWIMPMHDADLFDDDIDGFHFAHVSLKSASWKENDGQGSLSIKLTAFPYMVSNLQSTMVLSNGSETSATITTGSGHIIIPTVITTGAFSITIGTETYSVAQAGTYQMIKLNPGKNDVVFTGSATLSWNDEVL